MTHNINISRTCKEYSVPFFSTIRFAKSLNCETVTQKCETVLNGKPTKIFITTTAPVEITDVTIFQEPTVRLGVALATEDKVLLDQIKYQHRIELKHRTGERVWWDGECWCISQETLNEMQLTAEQLQKEVIDTVKRSRPSPSKDEASPGKEI